MNQFHLIQNIVRTVAILTLLVTVFVPKIQADDVKIQPSTERFVPVDQLNSILKRTPSGILLPKAEFQDLLIKARKAAQQTSPGNVVITSANYDLEAVEHHAIIKLTVQFRQFQNGWTTQTIPIGNLQLESALLNGTTATVGISDKQPGRLFILNNKVGTFDLELTLSTALLKSGTDRSVVFKAMDQTSATLKVKCPAREQVILNASKLKRPDSLEKATVYAVPIGHTPNRAKDVRMTWTTRRKQEISDNLIFATSDVRASFNAAGLKWNCESRLSVFGEKFDRLSASVPTTLEITNVESAGLEQWSLEDDPESSDRTRLQLKYRQPFAQDRLIRIEAISTLNVQEANVTQEANAQSAHSKIPTLQWNNLTAHTGQITVQTESSQRLLTQPVSGLNRIATQQQTGSQADVFDFWKQNFDLQVNVRSKDRELFSKIDSVLHSDDTNVTFQASLIVETLNEPLFDVSVETPEGWQINSLTDDSATKLPWTRTADGKSILIDLPQPVEAGGLLTMRLLASRTIDDPATSQTLPLPIVRIKDATQAAATYALSCANDLKLSFPELTGLVPIADSQGRLVFEAQTSTYSGTVQIDRKAARLATRSEIRTWMEPESVSTTIDLTVDVVNGSIRTLNIDLPEDLTADVRFQLRAIGQVPGQIQKDVPPQIQIIEQTGLPVQDGVRPFQLTFDRRFVGSVNLSATVTIDRTEDFEWSAPFVRITNAARQQGFIVFEARPEQQLSVVAQNQVKGLTAADASMVRPCPIHSGRRIAMVFRCVTANYSLAVSETTFGTQAVPSAVCQNIQNVVVYDAQQSIQRSAKIDFQTSGVQTLRFRLPQNSYLWSTVLNGEAVQVRRHDHDYLVALPTPAQGTSDQSHQLEVLFQSQANETSQQKDSQESVALLIDTNDGSSVNVEILQQSWKLSYPKTLSLTEIPKGFQLKKGAQKRGWIQSAFEYFRTYQRPSNETIFVRLIPVTLLLLALFVFTVLVNRRRWKVLLGLIVASSLLVMLTLSRPVLLPMFQAEKNSAVADSTSVPAAEQPVTEQAQILEPNAPQIPRPAQPGGSFGGGSFSGGFGGGGEFGDSGGFDNNDVDRERSEELAPNRGLSQNQGNSPSTDLLIDGLFDPNARQPSAVDRSRQIVPLQQLNSNAQLNNNDQQKLIRSDRNSAVLSVKAGIANPDHFLAAEFHSINSKATNQSLPVQLQSAQVRQAFLIIAAAIMVLLCLFFSKATPINRFIFSCFMFLMIAGLVPLLAVRWQPMLDGIFIGLCIGITIWICQTLTCLCANCCGSKRLVPLGNRSTNTGKSARTSAIILLLLGTSMNSLMTAKAAAQETSQTQHLQPDVVLPYKPGQPELLADKVFLPKAQFLKLYRLAHPDKLREDRSDRTAQLLAAYYKSGNVTPTENKQWVQEFTARYVVRTFDDQASMVVLPIQNVSLVSATIKTVSYTHLTLPTTPYV